MKGMRAVQALAAPRANDFVLRRGTKPTDNSFDVIHLALTPASQRTTYGGPPLSDVKNHTKSCAPSCHTRDACSGQQREMEGSAGRE
jgi:hypothetical protein